VEKESSVSEEQRVVGEGQKEAFVLGWSKSKGRAFGEFVNGYLRTRNAERNT